MNKNISIVVLNHNSAYDTIDCLKSLVKITYKNYNIIIIDNNSSDNSVKLINDFITNTVANSYNYYNSVKDTLTSDNLIKKYTFIKSEINGGYGHGNNIGIKYALKNGADYVLVLNNDTIVKQNFLEPMVKMCEENKNIGIVSGKIYFYDRPDTIWFNGGKFSSCTAKVEHFNFNEKDIGQVPKKPITFISGCMWLIPKHVFADVGFINEEYFMYVEDLEFCQRVLKQNYTLNIATESTILHKVGSSTGGKYSDFSVFWRTKNMNLFINKNIKPTLCRLIALVSFNLKLFINLCRNKKFSLLKIQLKAIKELKRNL